jgi:hypothetical protein
MPDRREVCAGTIHTFPDRLASPTRSDLGKISLLRRLPVKETDLLREHDRIDPIAIGKELHSFAAELYPICRSITGAGIRRTLAAIQERIPLEISAVATGTRVFRLDHP